MKRFFCVFLLLTSGLFCALAQQSGSCGENLTWTLDENGTLTISGTGEMYDFDVDIIRGPWGDGITQIIIEEGITHIGDFAFWDCRGLTGALTLPASLTSIGTYAFSGCRGFTGNLTLPANLINIGEHAFVECGFTGLTLPDGLTSIESYVFAGCNGLTGNLTFPASLISIGEEAFLACDGLTGLVLPANLTSIGVGAFELCSGLTGNLTLPDGLTDIGRNAFYNCGGFTDTLVLSKSLLNIGSHAFAGCGFSVVLNKNKTPIVIGSDVFQGLTLSDIKLCVPAGSREAYSQAEVWKEFTIEEYEDLTPFFSESREVVVCGTRISILTGAEAEIYYGLGKDATPTLIYTNPIVIIDTTYICAYSKKENKYSDIVYIKYIPIHSFSKVDWDWSAEYKASLSLTYSCCKTELKPEVSLSEELTKDATEEETGLKTYIATATANATTYKNTYREVLPRLKPIHDTVIITEVKTDTIIITDTVYIEVGTGNTVTETMKVKLYPNPTNGSFTVEAEEDAYLQIYNAAGVCIQSKQMQGGMFTGSLPTSGLYFIKLTARNRTYTKRLIVQ